MSGFRFFLNAILYINFIFLLANCSDSTFGGDNGNSNRANSVIHNDTPDDDDDDDKEEPKDSQNFIVYRVLINNYAADTLLDTAQLELEIPDDSMDQPIILFLHFFGPTEVTLTGDTDQIAAVFLSSNNSYASDANLSAGAFPDSLKALGFGFDYSVGSGIAPLIGQDLADQWENGTAIELYAPQVGPNKCFDVGFDTDIDSTPTIRITEHGYECPEHLLNF